MMEKRRYPRADLIFNLECLPEEGGEVKQPQPRDLSASGVSFCTEKELNEGELLNMALSIDGLPGRIEAKGRVVRSWNEGGKIFTAVEFEDIDPSDHEIVSSFIEEHLKDIGSAE